MKNRFSVTDQREGASDLAAATGIDTDASNQVCHQPTKTSPLYGRVIDQFELRAIKGLVSEWDFDKSLIA